MNWKILYKYVQGQCSKEELAHLSEWLKKSPANEDFFVTFIEEWDDEHNYEVNIDDQVAWSKFRTKFINPDIPVESYYKSIIDTESVYNKKVYDRQKNRKTAYWSYVSLAFVLLACITILIFIIQIQNQVYNSSKNQEPYFQEISTVRGQRSNLKLSDGSVVFLNSSSKLRIPQDFGKETRTIYLEGEAFFEVIHDETNPFIVISDGLYTKDLGTQFNISAYETGTVEVAVKEGLVSLGKMENGAPQKEIVEITPNKVGVYTELGGLTVTDINDMDKYVGWIEGRLVFQRTPFPEVMKRLERWYDIEMSIGFISDELRERTLTATYDNMPMSEVLQVMAVSMNLSFEREGRTILLHDLGPNKSIYN